MALKSGKAETEGASHFDPDALLEAWDSSMTIPSDNDLRSSIITTFNLPENDTYVYHAIASVTLAQVQAAISHGAGSGLHAWYLDNEGKPVNICLNLNRIRSLTI